MIKKEISHILSLVSSKNYIQAYKLSLPLYKKYSPNIEVLKIHFYILSLLDSNIEAIDEIQEYLKNNTIQDINDHEVLNLFGYFYLKTEEFEKSIELLDMTILKKEDFGPAHQNLAEVLIVKRDFLKALDHINKAINIFESLNKKVDEFFHCLILKADINNALNKNHETVLMLQNYLSEEFNENVFYLLSTIDTKKIKDEIMEFAEHKLTDNAYYESKIIAFSKTVPLQFGLANYYQKQDKLKSELYFHKANKNVGDILRYNLNTSQKSIINSMKLYDEFFKNNNFSEKEIGKNNIFIVGLPRTGTTLTESIITANDEIFPAGELLSFQDLFAALTEKSINEKRPFIDHISKTYLRRTSYLKNDYDKVVDKLPGNVMLIGFIRKILPGSKIIRIYRDPWDTAISLYKQRYVKNIPWSTNFFNIGIKMSNHEAMNTFWDMVLEEDNNITTIRYEDVVSKQKDIQTGLYDFLEIKSNYSEEKRSGFFSKTASTQQVKEKIHTKSVKKLEFEDKKDEFWSAIHQQRKYWTRQGLSIIENSPLFGYEP